jgi:protein ImuA
MRWVTSSGKTLQVQEIRENLPGFVQPLALEFEAAITQSAVHELLFNPAMGNPLPLLPALVAVQAVMMGYSTPRTLVWVDPTETFYPPAAIGMGISPAQLYVLRPRAEDLVWSTIECLRCQGVGAVVSLMLQEPTRVEVRRLQLAAERGGGVGLLLRPNLLSAGSSIYAATTRWLVAPAPGERTIQRWKIQLLHGHGGRTGQSFLLEKNRASGQTNLVRLPAPLVHHPTRSAAS